MWESIPTGFAAAAWSLGIPLWSLSVPKVFPLWGKHSTPPSPSLGSKENSPWLTGQPHYLSFPAHPLWRVCSHPLAHCICVSHHHISVMTTMSLFLLHHHFQFLQFVAHPVCISVDAFQWVIDPTAISGRKAQIPVWLFSEASVVSNTSIILVFLLLLIALQVIHTAKKVL